MSSPAANALRGASRLVVMALGAIALSSIAIGWCYLLRGPTAHWPGPYINNALPLDALPLHADISLFVFAVLAALAALLAGVLARALRFDGFAIALTVGAGIGAWIYVASAISYFIVEQSSLDQAFDATRDVQPIYVAGALFALGIVLVAGRRSGERWLTRAVPGVVGLYGVLNIVSATLPVTMAERRLLGGLLTGPSLPWTRTLEVTLGGILLFTARGLGRRSRRALLMASALVLVLIVARILDGFNVVALVVGVLVLLSLLARKGDFAFAGDPTRRVAGITRLIVVLVSAVIYGVLALFINRTAAGLSFHLSFAIYWTFHSLLIGASQKSSLIGGGFSVWFPWSLRAIVGLGLIWGAVSWFAPWRHHPSKELARREHAKALVDEFGSDTLAPFTLRQDKAYYLYPEDYPHPEDSEGATTVIAYRVVRGVALVSGDPIGPPEQASAAISAFLAMCAERGWRFALLGAGERLLAVYRSLGLRPLYHGDEAIVDVANFSLAGGNLKSVRQAVGRLQRNGYRGEIKTVGELDATERAELSALESRSLAGEKRKGFVMELDELFRLDGDDAIFVIGRNAIGALVGFLEIPVCRASASLSLSSMPRSAAAPNGLNAFLVVTAINWARERDFEAFSLNFTPAARLLDREARCTGWRRLARWILLITKRVLGLQLDNLLMFNRHFGPRWAPRYLVIDRYRHLPRVLVAAMAAERYLPFADLLLGRDWQMPVEEVAARGAPTVA